ncbi:MAG: hypothetical protein ACYSUI_21240 [Planctomycetota bacterium]
MARCLRSDDDVGGRYGDGLLGLAGVGSLIASRHLRDGCLGQSDESYRGYCQEDSETGHSGLIPST